MFGKQFTSHITTETIINFGLRFMFEKKRKEKKRKALIINKQQWSKICTKKVLQIGIQ